MIFPPILNSYYPMKGSIFVIYFNKRSEGLTMQIHFHSLLWSYLPRVLIFLAMTVYVSIYIYIYISMYGYHLFLYIFLIYKIHWGVGLHDLGDDIYLNIYGCTIWPIIYLFLYNYNFVILYEYEYNNNNNNNMKILNIYIVNRVIIFS